MILHNLHILYNTEERMITIQEKNFRTRNRTFTQLLHQYRVDPREEEFTDTIIVGMLV